MDFSKLKPIKFKVLNGFTVIGWSKIVLQIYYPKLHYAYYWYGVEFDTRLIFQNHRGYKAFGFQILGLGLGMSYDKE